MKTKLGIFLAGCCLLAFTACEKDLQPYNTPGAWLNFAFRESSGDLITSSEGLYDEIYDTYYSFALQSATTGTDITQDTVWIEVSTMGFLSDQDRQVELQQVVTGENDAVSGVHYVAFDDPALLAKSYVPAGQNMASVPIVVLRDASLDQHDVVLKITIRDNGVFKPGNVAHYHIVFAHVRCKQAVFKINAKRTIQPHAEMRCPCRAVFQHKAVFYAQQTPDYRHSVRWDG